MTVADRSLVRVAGSRRSASQPQARAAEERPQCRLPARATRGRAWPFRRVSAEHEEIERYAGDLGEPAQDLRPGLGPGLDAGHVLARDAQPVGEFLLARRPAKLADTGADHGRFRSCD